MDVVAVADSGEMESFVIPVPALLPDVECGSGADSEPLTEVHNTDIVLDTAATPPPEQVLTKEKIV